MGLKLTNNAISTLASSLTAASTTTSTTVANSGSSGVNANLQPYLVVKMWKRVS